MNEKKAAGALTPTATEKATSLAISVNSDYIK